MLGKLKWRRRLRKHGFLARKRGNVLKNRRAKGRKVLSPQKVLKKRAAPVK